MRKTSKIEKKIRKKKIGLMFVILFLITSLFTILFTQTNFFNISKIEVKNNIILESESIRLLSGIKEGENIFTVDTSLIKKSLLSHPYIKNVQVNRSFPNKIVVIIDERTEFFVMSCIGSYLLLDKEGVIIDIAQEIEDFERNFPLLEGLNVNNAIVGKKVAIDGNNFIQEVIDLLELCKAIDLYSSILKIEVKENFDIIFTLNSGTKVAFGDLNNVKYKLSFLVNIMDSLSKREDISQEQISKGLIDLTQGEDAIFTFDTD